MNAAQITQMPIADIEIEARLRDASPAGVASIASSILEVGEILKPLIVRKVKSGYRLLDGLHRLEAAKLAELETVPVVIKTCTNNEAVRIEVDTNVAGAPLNALDMAVFLAAHKAMYEKEHPETKHGKAGASSRWNGLVTLTFRSLNSFMRPFAQMPRGFCRRAMSGDGADCRTH